MPVSDCLSAKTAISLRLGTRSGPVFKNRKSPPQIDFLDLTEPDFNAAAPQYVLGWLFHEKYDAFKIARWLVKANYGGMFYGVCNPLPRKRVVLNDMKRAYPELRFDLMIVSEDEISKNPYEATLRFHKKPATKIDRVKTPPFIPA
ncbi:MAG: hypothetical protein Q9M48_15605 [Rhodobacterales bacterium]|nr:hypothetical protein [Rhodobacterales bacterium]